MNSLLYPLMEFFPPLVSIQCPHIGVLVEVISEPPPDPTNQTHKQCCPPETFELQITVVTTSIHWFPVKSQEITHFLMFLECYLFTHSHLFPQ